MAHHSGSCHCGAVRFTLDADLDTLATCNCSMCGRTGAIMVFVPSAALVTTGDDALTDYQFGKKSIHHTFCSTCGVRPFARGQGDDGSAWAMVNIRCVEGIDPHTLTIARQYDGRSL